MLEVTGKIAQVNEGLSKCNDKVTEVINNFKKHENMMSHIEETMKEIKGNIKGVNSQSEQIKRRQDLIDKQISSAIDTFQEKEAKIIKIYKETKEMISNMQKEYKSGFKRIVKCEIEIHEISNNIKLLVKKSGQAWQDKLLEENNKKVLQEVDKQLSLLYERISEMASHQADFNLMINNKQQTMNTPIFNEVELIRKENISMQYELERAIKTNRDILNKIEKLKSEKNSDIITSNFVNARILNSNRI